jgi:hypothetical protein
MLVNPKPTNTEGLRPVIELVEMLERLPVEQLEAIADDMCRAHEAELPGLARSMRRTLAEAKADGDLPIQLVRIGLMTGTLTSLVLRLSTDTAYKLGTAWWHAVGSLHNPERSIGEGNFAIDRKRFNEQTPEWEVANRPLFVTNEEFNRFLRFRPFSEGQLRREGQAIVAEFQRDHPDQMLKKKEFIARIVDRLAGCSKARAMWAWRECVPPRWRKPGLRP